MILALPDGKKQNRFARPLAQAGQARRRERRGRRINAAHQYQMSKREEMRQRRQKNARRKQGMAVGLTIAAAVLVTGYLIYQNSRPVGDFVAIEKQSLPYADGKSLGKVDAPVLVQEFSDFQ